MSTFLEPSAFGLIDFGARMTSSVGAAVRIGKNRSMAIEGGKIEPPSDQVYRKESGKERK